MFNDSVPKTMAKMGAYIIVMPDKVWYDTETGKGGYMEQKTNVYEGQTVTFSMCAADGTPIEWHTPDYYEGVKPKDGDYMMSTSSSGKPSLKTYSETTGIWLGVASTYVQISAAGIGDGFEKDDGIKITSLSNIGSGGVEVTTTKDDDTGEVTTTVKNLFDVNLDNILVTKEENGIYIGEYAHLSLYRRILAEPKGWEWFNPIRNEERYKGYITRIDNLISNKKV